MLLKFEITNISQKLKLYKEKNCLESRPSRLKIVKIKRHVLSKKIRIKLSNNFFAKVHQIWRVCSDYFYYRTMIKKLKSREGSKTAIQAMNTL